MIEIIQQKDFAIGSLDSIKMLAEKDSARILVISDSHGSKNIVQQIISRFGSECDGMCFCGDGNPDLCSIIETNHKSELLPPVIFFVQGNGDNSTSTILTNQRLPISVPAEVEFTVCGKKIFMTHGHRYNVYMGTNELKKTAQEKEAQIAFYGHTHVANAQIKNKILLLNPGSCSLPRGGLPHTFAIVELKKNEEKINYNYFELKWDANGEIEFIPFTPPKGEINLFW